MHQHAAWCLVYILRGGDSSDTVFFELVGDRDFVGSIAGQTVQLVDNDVVYASALLA